MENKKSNSQSKTQFKRDTKNFLRDEFILDYLDIDWDFEMEIEKSDVNHSTEKFFSNMNNLIDKHMPLRKLSAKERKQKTHPWITPAIIAKINRKNKLYKKFIKSKKREDQLQFNQIKNEITSLTRKSKKEYYKNYFNTHNKNLKKIWNGIKEIINIKQKSSSSPSCLKDDDKILTDEKEIANHFNCYFSGIAENVLHNRECEGKHTCHESLKNSFKLACIFNCYPNEVDCLSTSLELNKGTGPFTTPVMSWKCPRRTFQNHYVIYQIFQCKLAPILMA